MKSMGVSESEMEFMLEQAVDYKNHLKAHFPELKGPIIEQRVFEVYGKFTTPDRMRYINKHKGAR